MTLEISIANGSLAFIRLPLLLGHYSSTRLTGAEAVMNGLTGGAMGVALHAGLYPEQPGTHQVFINTAESAENPLQPPRPAAVVIVGLGSEGKLRGADLATSVRQGVLAWAQRAAEQQAGCPPLFDIAATLIGSGGSGVTVGQSAQAIAQGVRDANRRLSDESDRGGRWPRVRRLQLVELYHDRALEAWRALRIQAAAMPGQFVVADVVSPGVGWLPRPLQSGYRGAAYDFLSATSEDNHRGESAIAYTIDTKRARTEVRAQIAQTALIRNLVHTAASDRNTDIQMGRTLFRLLVPMEVEPFLTGTTEMQLELDMGTAGIPWELLDTNTDDRHETLPWAIRAKVLRTLRTARFRAQVSDASLDSRVLVIGEPKCDPARYARLPGAREEALAVADCLTGAGGLRADRVVSLISPSDPEETGPDARVVLNTLLPHEWRIVHIAGHGEPPDPTGATPPQPGDPEPAAGNPRGIVLSDGIFLGAREIDSMRRVPELVFVNCCYLAAGQPEQLLAGARADLPQFACGVAEALIKAGVRCVVAAGWAVEDEPAKMFAMRFYEALLGGSRFIDAVAHAREGAHARGGNTWAAYQCYGDPDWVFCRDGADAQRPATSPVEEFSSIASSQDLRLALGTLAVRSEFQGADSASQRTIVGHLESRFEGRWGACGDVAEAFGAAWAAIGDRAAAIRWYEAAVAAPDGSASLKAVEELANLAACAAWDDVDAACQRVEKVKGRPAVAKARRTLVRASQEARARIHRAIGRLETVSALQPTMERESLMGSAWKRLAMIESIAGRRPQADDAIARMRDHYERAEGLGERQELPGVFYPALNRLAGELIVTMTRARWKGFDRNRIDALRTAIAAVVQRDPDFWSVASQTELLIYEAISRRNLQSQLPQIVPALAHLHGRISAPRKWQSIHDQARLVVGRYAHVASGHEKEAARTLLRQVATFAAATSPRRG